MQKNKRVVLRRRREDSVKRFHPWIFSGAVESITGSPAEGDVVEVFSSEGEFLAYGHYQVGSIAVRILAFDKEFTPNENGFGVDFWISRISAALDLRRSLPLIQTTAYRLIHGEGDMLPGLIIDMYDGVAVIQAHSAGMFLSRKIIVEALCHCFGDQLKAVYDKSEGTAPFKAGLDLHDGYLYPESATYTNGAESPITDFGVVVKENGVKFFVDWERGQKTGFFLDQRDNRALVGSLSRNRRVLNLFCYTGGFSMYALNNGAKKVVSVDSSATAIEMLEKNLKLNCSTADCTATSPIDTAVDCVADRHTSVCADAIDYLHNVPKDEFDLIIVDPPAFAKHRGALDNALRAYRRLNAAAIEKVASGGFVFTFSCSQVVDKQAFQLAVFSAAAQTHRRVRILRRLSQGADHPVNIYHPEGEYLKGLLLYVE